MLLRHITEEDVDRIGKLFSTPQGKQVMKILDKAIYNTVSFIPGQDTETGIFKDGQRDLVHLFKMAVETVALKEE